MELNKENVLDGASSQSCQVLKPAPLNNDQVLQKPLRQSVSTFRPAKAFRTKRRTLGDITNRRTTPLDNSKEIKKMDNAKPKRNYRGPQLRHIRRIPVDSNGNVSSPEYIPSPRPLPPFEPPVFDFDDLPNKHSAQRNIDIFHEASDLASSPTPAWPKSPPPNYTKLLEFEDNMGPAPRWEQVRTASVDVDRFFEDTDNLDLRLA